MVKAVTITFIYGFTMPSDPKQQQKVYMQFFEVKPNLNLPHFEYAIDFSKYAENLHQSYY